MYGIRCLTYTVVFDTRTGWLEYASSVLAECGMWNMPGQIAKIINMGIHICANAILAI